MPKEEIHPSLWFKADEIKAVQVPGRSSRAGRLAAQATFAWAREENGLVAWMVREATGASFDGALLFRSDLPVTMAADLRSPEWYVFTVAADQPACVLGVAVPKDRKVTRVFFADKALGFNVAGDTVEIAVPGPGRLVMEFGR